MSQTKFNYTNGGEFQKSDGSDYVGYFNINDSGEAYSGRYFNSDSFELLTPVSIYSADYYRSSNFRDRFVFDTLTLPNSLQTILINDGEMVNYSTINSKIKRLHENLIYLHSKMFMGATDVPTDKNFYVLAKGLNGNSFEWRRSTAAFEPLSTSTTLSAYSEFDNMKKFVVIPLKSSNGYSILGISDTHIIGLTSSNINNQLSSTNITFYRDTIDNNTSEKFLNLEDIAFDGNFVYVTDSQINSGGQVFKYNANAFYTNDPVFESKLFLVDTIGGAGDLQRFNKFKGCSIIGTKNTEVWIYDKGNKSIKVYDSNFVWKNTIGIPKLYDYEILDLKYRKLDDSMYGLFKNNTLSTFGIFRFESNYTIGKTSTFSDVLDTDSDVEFTRMAISEQDSNVFYLLTRGTIFKKFFSKPEKTFATFSRDEFYPDDSFVWSLIDDNWENVNKTWSEYEVFKLNFYVTDVQIIEDTENVDNLFLIGPSAVYRFRETTNYETVLRDPNLKYYNYNRIEFSKKEYNQSFVANKEFYKLFSNIIQFKNVLKGRFFFEFDRFGDLAIKDYVYLTDSEINELSVDLEFDSFINDNELTQPNVINRLFKKVYDFQQKVVDLTQIKILNLKNKVRDTNVVEID